MHLPGGWKINVVTMRHGTENTRAAGNNPQLVLHLEPDFRTETLRELRYNDRTGKVNARQST